MLGKKNKQTKNQLGGGGRRVSTAGGGGGGTKVHPEI